jgi:hypothetical protein
MIYRFVTLIPNKISLDALFGIISLALGLKLQLIENLVAKKLHLTSLRRSSKSAKCHLS